MDLNKYRDKLLFVPLGGAEEIGMNMYLYHFNGKWIIVDMGMGFADESLPGVDIVVPDISFLLEIKKNILGIVLTHAHEDHIGAIQYLWNELQLDVYATKFTATVVKAKCSDIGIADTSFIKIKDVNSKFKLGDFDLEYIGLTHSVLEMQGLVIKTIAGTLFHTGDWKFDKDPVVGEESNIKRLKKLGKDGVLAMICDSTNIFNEGRSGSEGELAGHLADIISHNKKGMIVVTSFASNIARVKTIAQAARSSGRKVALAGRSLWRMTDAARQCGYLDDLPEFIKTKNINNYKKNEILVIATGCQGEPLAAISKMANSEHPDVSVTEGDLVIFSSKIIPGNESKILPLFNHFARKKVHVMTENEHMVHVSGHPSRDELKEMYSYIKPKIAIPVHGEVVHTFEHVDFAKSLGVEQAFRVDDGNVILFSEDSAKIIGKISTGYLAIDGNFFLEPGSDILKSRRRMRDHGLLHCVIIVGKNNKLLKNPIIIAPGLLDPKQDENYFDMLSLEIRDCIENNPSKTASELEDKIYGIIKKLLRREINKEPKIYVSVTKVVS